MSATISWQPVEEQIIDCSIPNQMQAALHRAFGGRKFQWELTCDDLSVLQGIVAGNRHLEEAIGVLMEGIMTHGRIRVSAEG